MKVAGDAPSQETALIRLLLILGSAILAATLGPGCGKPVASATDSIAPRMASIRESPTKPGPVPGDPKAESQSTTLSIEEPDEQHPVTAGATFMPARVRPGEFLALVVQVKTAPRWHIYAGGAFSGTGMATTLKLELPEGIATAGDWTYPPPVPASDRLSHIYEGTVEFRRQLKSSPRVPLGPIRVTCELSYQACDPFSCRPPEKVALKATAEIVQAP
jgi:hypothetical protein